MLHEHHHEGHLPNDFSDHAGRAFLWGIGLNVAFVLCEFSAGFWFDSMGLLADAGHNLGDVGGLALSWGAFMLAQKRHARNYTYGFRKSTVLASLFNAVILFVAVGAIVLECVQKIREPAEVGGWPIIITAGIGIVVNGLTVFLFNRDREHDLNVKSAYIHMIADTLVSVGVVLSGVVILWTGWSLIDPILGLVVALVILASAWGLMRESVRLSLDGIPVGINLDELREHMLNTAHVLDVHHLHVWPISTTETALTAHVVLSDFSVLESVKKALHAELSEHGIGHVTLEFEDSGCDCEDTHLA